jgi:hypothetical protein
MAEPAAAIDPRRTPARPDLAAAHLKGLVAAERFVDGMRRGVVAASAPLRRRPALDAPLDSEALHGETVFVYEEKNGFAFAQLERDGYVGYLPSAALGLAIEPTHRVAVLRTHAYPGLSIKAPPRMAISLGAVLRIERFAENFAISADGAHYFARHLMPVDACEPDFVAVAERFLETPYLWGGRTSEGIDCSGLVQTALRAAGAPAPRDSDMLEHEVGASVPQNSPLRRGDLVFWRGHVGILADAKTLIHANGWHMRVVKEAFSEAKARIAANGGGAVTSVRRVL